ncbi:MAG: flagella basal body P-ring formation protein FlgA [Terricaulis sp.]
MLRALCLGACLTIAAVGAANADTVTLRSRVEASGPSITLGDLFVGAGSLSGRAIGPAPAAGQVTTLSMTMVSMAASAAGLDFTPPPGVTDVQVVHPAGPRATLPPNNAQVASTSTGFQSAPAAADIAVRRGEAVLLTYQVGGVSLSTRVQAMDNGAVGQSLRFTNPTSNRIIMATVTGPGAASASP